MKPFFNNNKSDFEQFRIRINFDNVTGSELTPLDLASYSFHIESRGRARQMFMFNRYDQPFFVSTYTEVYIADKKYISVKEAKKLDSHEFSTNEIETFMPNGTPPLQQSTLELIDRVNNIDETGVRLATVIDSRLKSPYINKPKPGIGKRVLSALKRAIGITSR